MIPVPTFEIVHDEIRVSGLSDEVLTAAFRGSKEHLVALGKIHLATNETGMANILAVFQLPFSPYPVRWHHRVRYWFARKTGDHRTVGALALRYAPQLQKKEKANG